MRKYYIFNINKEMSILAKDSPYMLYKSFETIYNSNKKEINIAQNLYEQLAMRINQNVINQKIYAEYKDNDYYYLVNNSHNYYIYFLYFLVFQYSIHYRQNLYI